MDKPCGLSTLDAREEHRTSATPPITAISNDVPQDTQVHASVPEVDTAFHLPSLPPGEKARAHAP